MYELNNYINRKIEEKRITSYNINVLKKGEKVFSAHGGYSVLKPKKIKTGENTIYDLASLTKPLATSLISAILIEKQEINIKDNLGKFFPCIGEDKKNITVEQLLNHSSGIISWKPLYYKEQNFNSILKEAFKGELEKTPGEAVIYSCLNYIILKGIIEKITGEKYTKLFDNFIKKTLKLKNTYFNPPADLKERISATEEGNNYEKKKALNIFRIRVPERKGVIWGKVHDCNSFYSGGTAGNSGLFSTAAEVSRIGMEFLKSSRSILRTETLDMFYENQTPFSSVHRSAGFILKTTESASISSLLSDRAIYHLGFTGTSIMIEPEKDLIITILLNRVHPIVREPTPKDIIKKIQSIILRKYV